MTQIKLKRVYEDYDEKDGFRVLVDRLWPRGIKKEHLHYDVWAKDITPSSTLREFFHENEEERWDTFKAKYLEELKASSAVNDFIDQIKKYPIVTLLYASKNAEHNHALILKDFLEKKLKDNK